MEEIRPEDIFGRELIKEDVSLIGDFIRNKRVLITGAAGSIGSELSRQILKYNPKKLILLDQNEFGIYELEKSLVSLNPNLIKTRLVDIKDFDFLSKIFRKDRPEMVFHAAAYKHVPIVENNPEVGINNNVLGTRNVFQASLENDVQKTILISTDKAVQPTSVMGKTKKVAEMLARAYHSSLGLDVITVRFGNVLNSSGSVIPLFLEQIQKGGPVTVTHKNMERFFMTREEACLLVLEASAIGVAGSTYVLDMGEMIRIDDVAKKLIEKSGREIDIVYTHRRSGERFKEKLCEDTEVLEETLQRKIYSLSCAREVLSMEEINKFLTSLDVSTLDNLIGHSEILTTSKIK